MKYYGLLAIFLMVLNGCQFVGQPSFNERADTLQNAQKNGFKQVSLQTDTFLLSSYQRIHKPGWPVNLYIEGDGRSWMTPHIISPNPTPVNPLALKLAIADKHPNVVYLARPCQYTSHLDDEFCNPLVWTDERFSPKVITAMNQAIDQIKKAARASQIHLVGFSGGGGLAVLMAAHRKNKDVASIRTVAGDLDIVAMTAYHKASPMQSSLNPKDYAQVVADIPQIHFVGEQDQVVPLRIAQGFVQALRQSTQANTLGKYNQYARLQVVEAHDHQNGWTESWARLLRASLQSPHQCEEVNKP